MTVLVEDATDLLLENAVTLLLEGAFSTSSRVGTPPMQTSIRSVVLVAPTYETLEVEVYCSANPTATAPQFAMTAEGTLVNGSTTYYAGDWGETYGTDGWTFANTPPLGSAGTIVISSGTRLWLWVKVVTGAETAVWRIGTVIVL